MRNKKVYYESGYKLTKGETESDLTKYLGGKAAHEDLINKIEGVLESYKRMFLLTALAVVAAIILAYILACLIKAHEQIHLVPIVAAPDDVNNIVIDVNKISKINKINTGSIKKSKSFVIRRNSRFHSVLDDAVDLLKHLH